jgi:hypothetical protein
MHPRPSHANPLYEFRTLEPEAVGRRGRERRLLLPTTTCTTRMTARVLAIMRPTTTGSAEKVTRV